MDEIKKLKEEIDSYLEENLVEEEEPGFFGALLTGAFAKEKKSDSQNFLQLDELAEDSEEAEEDDFFTNHTSFIEMIDKPKESFQEMLFRLIDQKGLDDVEVYKKAGIDRKYFSKIRSGSIPVKKTVLALILALGLNLDESKDLLNKAGYGLSDAKKFDLICQYCIEHEIYNLPTINEILYEYTSETL